MFEKRKQRRAALAAQAHARRCEQLRQLVHTARTFDGYDAPAFPVPGVQLRKGERGYFGLTGAALIEPRRGAGHWEGHSQGVSVHIPGTRSMRYRVGATKGVYVRGDERPAAIDNGTFVITNQRAVFFGNTQTREWAWAKLVAVTHSAKLPWTTIAVSNRQKASGVAYDREHEELIRFWLDLAIAKETGEVETVIGHLEGELAASGCSPSPAAAPDTVGSSPRVLAAPAAPPSWYPDPTGRYEYRYWDGTAWTDQVSRAGVTGHDAPSR